MRKNWEGLNILEVKKSTKKKSKRVNKAKEAKKSIRKLYDEWTEKVKERDGWVCQLCGAKNHEPGKTGKPTVLNAHHIIARDNKQFPELRFDVENGITLCAGCHRFSRNGPHHGTIIFSEWLRRKFPDRYQYLVNKVFTNSESCDIMEV